MTMETRKTIKNHDDHGNYFTKEIYDMGTGAMLCKIDKRMLSNLSSKQ